MGSAFGWGGLELAWSRMGTKGFIGHDELDQILIDLAAHWVHSFSLAVPCFRRMSRMSSAGNTRSSPSKHEIGVVREMLLRSQAAFR